MEIEKELLTDKDLDTMGIGSRTSRWRGRQNGEFPEPRKVLGRLVWTREEIQQYLESRPRVPLPRSENAA